MSSIVLTDGDDFLSLRARTVPVEVFALDGNDTMIDGHLSDTIHGGAGNDMITAGNDDVG